MLLIISKNKKLAKSVADTFYYMSILAYAATPHEALSEISGIYRAALIINPSEFPDIRDFVIRLKSYNTDIPVFALTNGENEPCYPDVFEQTFNKPTFTPSLAEKIIKFANETNRAKIGDYRLAGFDASSNVLGVNYFYNKVELTKTEAMILRYLIRSYPIPKRGEDIIKYAFKSSRAPEAAGIRTHISLMNKKFEQYLGKRMLAFVPHRGYVILTPEYERIVQNM